MTSKTVNYSFIFFILTSIFLFFKFQTLNVDSTWILYVSSQIVEGKTLYIDVSEVNPPLIFIYSTFAIFISKITTLTYIQSYIIFTSLLILCSIYLSFIILKKSGLKKDYLNFYLYTIAFLLTIATLPAFGQREHLLIIFIFPYILYSMLREKIKLTQCSLVFIILFTTLGLNLKPHFFLIIVFIEIVNILHFRKIFFFIRWEIFFIVFSGIIYLISIFLFFPEYINIALPLAVETYTTLFNKSLSSLLINYELFIFLLVIFIWTLFTKREISLDIKVLFITVISLLLIYLAQQKGWFYHRLPFFLITLFLLFHIIINYIPKSKKLYFISLIPLIIIVILIHIQRVPNFIELKNILADLPKYSKIHIISTDIARGQTLLVPNKQVWSSRFGALGILPAVLDNKKPKIKKYLFDSLYNDLIKYKPDTLIFCGKYSRFNYYKYFKEEDKRLKNIYNLYYTKSIIDGYTVLKKIKDFQ